MTTIWTLISEYENKHKIRPDLCRNIISESRNVQEVQERIIIILRRLRDGDMCAIEEAWSVGVPLSYRLAIDDTSNNFRIASNLKETALWLAEPRIMSCISDEIEWLCNTAYGIKYSTLDQIQFQIEKKFVEFTKLLNGEWRVYSRKKSISSILQKLSKFKNKEKATKITIHNDIIDSVLNRFELQVQQRMEGKKDGFLPYYYSEIKWMLPDILGFTLQMTERGVVNKNLGTAKARYKGVYTSLKKLPENIFYGPSYSNAWHMNRMVCYMEKKTGSNLFSQINYEVFIRTDFDYFIGYSNYWRYKGLDLFATYSPQRNIYRDELIKKLRLCSSFKEVQDILFKEVTTGQLTLF